MEKFPISYWRNVADDAVNQAWRDRDIENEQAWTGWSCWAYATHTDFDLRTWMETNMTGKYDCTLRFNSGDPMYTVWIKEEKDAAFFALTFL
jgi:hypothetical protein